MPKTRTTTLLLCVLLTACASRSGTFPRPKPPEPNKTPPAT